MVSTAAGPLSDRVVATTREERLTIFLGPVAIRWRQEDLYLVAMHSRTLSIALVACFSTGLGCGKDANTKICLDEFAEFEKAVEAKDAVAGEKAPAVYQSCGISCDVVEDDEACAAFKKVTEVICEKEGKDACQDLCDKGKGTDENPEKNEHACAAVAKM